MRGLNTMPDDWSRQIGEKHGHRDRAAAREAKEATDAERELHASCAERWPAIVAAMTSMVTSYNHGAGLEAVTVVEDTSRRGHPSVTVESATNGRRALVIALDGSEVAVRTRSGPNAPLSGTQWVSLNRTDENAASYLLRDWMERL
jgi:hypothetical protein